MGLCQAKPSDTLDRPGSSILTVWGDFFQPETRTLMIMIQIAGINHEFREVD